MRVLAFRRILKVFANLSISCTLLWASGGAAQESYPTDSETIRISLGETEIVVPKTQRGRPTLSAYENALTTSGQTEMHSVADYSGTMHEAVEKYYEPFGKETNDQLHLQTVTIAIYPELYSKIVGDAAGTPDLNKPSLIVQLDGLLPDENSKNERRRLVKDYHKWFKEQIRSQKPDELGMVAGQVGDTQRWIGTYRFPDMTPFGFLSVKNEDMTPFGDFLVFRSGCNLDLSPSKFGFCKVSYYWKVDMIVRYEFDARKLPRRSWHKLDRDVRLVLRYLETAK